MNKKILKKQCHALSKEKDFTKTAFSALKESLTGLPFFPRLVIYELLSYCDYATGIISLPTLDELLKYDFHVEAAPGRKKDLITADTLRNAFRTIKAAKPEQFIFRTENQRIIIEMPFLKALYEESWEVAGDLTGEVAGDLMQRKYSESLVNKSFPFDCNAHLTRDVAADLTGEVAAASFFQDIYNNNNTNNNHKCGRARLGLENQESVQPIFKKQKKEFSSYQAPTLFGIEDNFFPNEETIVKALKNGYDTVIQPNEIQSFISYNQAIGSQWADYNPVYLKWLSKKKEVDIEQQKTRRAGNESSNSNNSFAGSKPRTKQTFEELMQAISQCNPNPLAPSETDLFALPPINFENFDPLNCLTHGVALEATNEHLQSAIY